MNVSIPRTELEPCEARRNEAVRRMQPGESRTSVAADVGVGSKAVYQRTTQASEQGMQTLKLKPRRGRKAKRARKHWGRLGTLLLNGPRAGRFKTEYWKLSLISESVQKKLGVD